MEPGAHVDHAPAAVIGLPHPAHAVDNPTGGKIRRLDVLHEFVNADIRIVDQGLESVDHLRNVVRRNLGGHAHGNTHGAIAQQVGETPRQNFGLLAGLIVVVDEVDRVFVQVAEHLHSGPAQTGFGVAHGRGRVPIDGTEIPLSIHHGVAHAEFLRHMHQGGIDNGLAMRVVIARSIAGNFGALAKAAVGHQTQIVHRHQNAALRGLETIAHVRQRSRQNGAHGIVEKGGLEFLLDFDRNDPGVFLLQHIGSGSFLNVQVLHVQRVRLDKFAPRLHLFTH